MPFDDAPRWRVQCRTDGDGAVVHVVTCRIDPLGLPAIVRPTKRGFDAAARLAAALDRAYGTEPASGFDVAGLLGLAFAGVPRVIAPPLTRAAIAFLRLGAIF